MHAPRSRAHMLPVTLSGCAGHLPDLSDADVHAIAHHARDVLADLLTTDSLSANTMRSYASALRYWDAWHRAALGRPLPLFESPRQPVTTEAVRAFIAHHTPIVEGGVTALSMPDMVRERLHRLVAGSQRRVGDRAPRIDADLASLATVKHRLSALSACHRIAGLEPEWVDDSLVRRAVRALSNRASKSAPAMLRQPKKDVDRGTLTDMLHDCLTDGIRGLRDAALLHVAFHTGGRRRSELTQMHWNDLTPLRLPGNTSRARDGYMWTLREMKGKRRERADGGVMDIPILGEAAAALDRWRAALLAVQPDLAGPVWWRVIAKRRGADEGWKVSTPMIPVDVWHMIRTRAARVGLRPEDFGAHSLRSGGATTFLREGGALADAANMLGHTKIDTTRQFYDRRGVPIAAVARLVEGNAPTRNSRD